MAAERTSAIGAIACPCGAAEATAEIASSGAIFRCCGHCGSWYRGDPVTSEGMRTIFESTGYFGEAGKPGSGYGDYLADEPARRQEAAARFASDLEPLFRNRTPKVLEIGCATGTLLAECRRHGWNVTGVDWSPIMARAARETNDLPVISDDLLRSTQIQPGFDLVMMFGTFSNFPTPLAHLRRVRDLLNADGVLVFNFVDADSFAVRHIYGKRCWMFMPSVAYFPTERAIRILLREAGFDIQTVRVDRQRPSIDKLLRHGMFRWLADSPLLKRFRHITVPFSLPLPGIRLVVARPASAGPA
jgi:SAM-dependent methyltransferase